jgi:hypothetical protein
MHSTFCQLTMIICAEIGRSNIPNAPAVAANEERHVDGSISFQAQPGFHGISNQQVGPTKTHSVL